MNCENSNVHAKTSKTSLSAERLIETSVVQYVWNLSKTYPNYLEFITFFKIKNVYGVYSELKE